MQVEGSNGQHLKRRIVHITSWLSRRGGGIPPVIWSLARETQKLGNESFVSGLKDEYFEADCGSQAVKVIAGTIRYSQGFGYSPELCRSLTGNVHGADMLHVHGIWMYPGALARRLSQRTGCRRVVSPHGMLEPWALKQSRWKKNLASWLFENSNLHTADCLHALCEAEAESFRKYGLRNPIAIIPNGVDLEKSDPQRDKQELWQEHPDLCGRQLLLFLSRVHPKKGLPDLFRAWAKQGAGDKNWSLIVVGPNESGHETELRQLAAELEITQHIHFMGPAYGIKKRRLLAAADGLALPSHSEGFSMAVLEAAAAGLPVLLTKECNFPELAAAGAAIEMPAGAVGVAEGFEQFLKLTDGQRRMMGGRGRELVARAYTWPVVASEMARVYDWLANKGPKPNCIQAG